MKASFKFFLAALAATAALAGCVQEITPPSFEKDKVNPAAEGSRVIAVSFAPQTKTALDGFQPKFNDGDSILISNGVALDTCEVSVDGDKATISTDLTGPLTAVYPYKAAMMNGSNANQVDSVLVSTEQDGTFANANICMAENISEDAKEMTFVNKTALFRIIPVVGAQYVEVRADGYDIANDYPDGSSYTNSQLIHVSPITADTVYVSILVPDGIKVGNLTFSDGTNEKSVTTGATADKEIAAGTLYTVTNENWETPKADIPGALKGVFTVSDNGTPNDPTDDIKVRFSQGNLRYVVGAEKWSFYDHQYDHCNTSTYEGHHSDTVSLFTWGYNATKSVDPEGTGYVEGHTTDGELFSDSEDWGSQIGNGNTWRTLTNAEWAYLLNTRTDAKNKVGYATVSGVHGIILLPDTFTDPKKNNGIDEFFPASVGEVWESNVYTAGDNWNAMELAGAVFLPAAGTRTGSFVDGVGDYGCYWSSTAQGEYFAYDVYFLSGNVYSDFYVSRNLGSGVRLVTDVSATPVSETDAEIFVIATDNVNGINPTSFSVKPSDREFTYWIGRSASEKACTVSIINHSDSRFTVPSSVTFLAGEIQAPLVITFSDTLPEEDCTVSFEIDGADSSGYGSGSFSFTGVLNCIPFYKRVLGNYTSDVIHDYWGDSYYFNFNVVPSQDNPTGKVVIENLDPFLTVRGVTADKGYNSFYGLIDEDNSRIVIPIHEIGIEDWELVGFDDPDPDVAEYYVAIYIRYDWDDTLTFTNAWGLLSTERAGYCSLYYGGFSCKKNTPNIQKSASCNVTPMTLPLPRKVKTKTSFLFGFSGSSIRDLKKESSYAFRVPFRNNPQ